MFNPDPESNRLFGKMKKQQSFKTVPLERPYHMPLDVKIESNSATRKLHDFGVYRAQSRNFDVEETSSDLLPQIWNEVEKVK